MAEKEMELDTVQIADVQSAVNEELTEAEQEKVTGGGDGPYASSDGV